jgi:hypothetical protein
LSAAVQRTVQAQFESGAVAAIVEKQIASSVASIVRDLLSEYSDFGKQLREHIKGNLRVDLSTLSLSEYNQLIISIIRAKLEGHLARIGQERMAADLEKMLGEAAPKEITATDLIRRFKRWAAHRGDVSRRVAVYIDAPSEDTLAKGYWHLYLDTQERTTKYACEIQIGVSPEGKMYSCTLSGHDPKKSVFMGALYGFPADLFRLYAAGTRLVWNDPLDSGSLDGIDAEEDEEAVR